MNYFTHLNSFSRTHYFSIFFPGNSKEIGPNLIGRLETMVPRFERNFRNLCGENQTLKITSKNRQEIFERIWLFIHRNKWQEYKCTHRFCQIKKQIVFLLKILCIYVHPHIFRPSVVPAGTKDLGAFNNYVDIFELEI